MFSKILRVLVLLSLHSPVFSQSLEWLNINDGGGEQYLYSSGEKEVFLSKHTSDGSLLCSSTGGSNKIDELLSVGILPDGTLLVGGYISRSTELQTSEGLLNINTSTTLNRKRALLLHMTSDGAVIDCTLHDDAEDSAIIDTAIDDSGYTLLIHPSIAYLGQDSVRMGRFWGGSENIDLGTVRLSLPDSANNPYTAGLISTDSLFTELYDVICLSSQKGKREAEYNAVYQSFFPFVTTSFTVLEDITDVSCNGLSDGSINLNLLGDGPFSFEWEGLGIDETGAHEVSGLSAGIYTVNITDGIGCLLTFEYEIAEPEELIISTLSIENVACLSSSDGEASFEITGGIADYLFSLELNEGEGPVELHSDEVVPADGMIDLMSLSIGSYTLYISDSQGCDVSVNFSISNSDTTAPFIQCFVSITREVAENCSYVLEDFASGALITEACSIVSISQSPAPESVLSLGIHTIELSATDDSGNTESCTFQLTVEDNTAPLLVCPAEQERGVNSLCNYALEDLTSAVVSSDNCSSIAVAQTPSSGTFLPIGVHTISFIGIDEALNSSNCSLQLTVSDLTPPTITCIPDRIEEVGYGCVYTLESFIASVNSSDNCGLVTLTQMPLPGTELTTGTYIIELISADAAGNTSVCSFEFEVVDTGSPILVCPNDITRFADASCNYIIEDFTSELIVTDLCEVASILQIPASGTPVGVGVQAIGFVVTDNNGNTTSCSFNVTIEDNLAPLINCLETVEIELENSCTYEVPNYSSVLSISESCGIQLFEQSIPAGTELGVGTYVILVEATDVAGNFSDCSITLEVSDNYDPVYTCLPDQDLELISGCGHVLEDFTTLMNISDNCGISSIVQSPSPGTLLALGSFIISVAITDLSGNLSGCNFQVMIIDTVNPTIACMSDQTVWPNADCIYMLQDFTGLVATSDNCAVASVVQNPSAGAPLTVGIHLIELTVYDESNNHTTCSFELTVEDAEAPVIACPEPVAIDLITGCTYAIEDFISSTMVTDNCGIDEVIQLPAEGTLLGLGWQTVTILATDLSGNTSSCSFQLFVQDVQAPAFVCITDQIRSLSTDCNYVLENFTDVISIDENCSVASVTQTPAAGTALDTGEHTILIQVVDNSGLSTLCEFLVDVQDSSAPVIDCVNELNFEITSCAFLMPSLIDEVVVEAECSAYSIIQSINQGTSIAAGTYGLEFTVTDAFGNMNSCATTLNILDSSSPVFNCEAIYEVLPFDGCDFIAGDWVGIVTATDNCPVTISSTLDGQTLSAGSYPIEFTAQDSNGNQSNCSSVIEVLILQEPTVVCPTEIEISIDADCTTFVPDASDYVLAASECGNSADLIFSQDLQPGIVFDFDAPLTVSVEDEFGQIASCTTQLIRLDDSAPLIECQEVIIVELNSDCSVPTLDLENFVLIEDCSLTSTQTDFNASDIDGPGLHQVIYEVIDASGLTATCTSQISFQDVENPDIDCLTDQVQALGIECNYVLPDFTELVTTFDACGSVVVNQTPLAGLIFSSPQEVEVTLIAEDASGNENTCSFMLELIDQSAPEIICVENQEVEFEGCALTLPSFISGLSDDVCGVITYTQEPAAGTTMLPGIYAIEITATDESMNASSCAFELTIIKTDVLQLICAEPIEVVGAECELEVADYTSFIEFTNACGEVVLNQSPAPGTFLMEEVSEITIYATDDNSDVACTFELTYTVDPIVNVVCTTDVEVDNDPGLCGATVTYPMPQIDVSCGTPELILTEGLPPGSFFNVGETEIIYNIEINNEIHSSCTFTVTVLDAEMPEIECASEIISCEATVFFELPSVADNCGDLEVLQIDGTGLASGDEFPFGSTELQFMATDNSGNESICSLIINVVEPPVLVFTEESVFACVASSSFDLNAALLPVDGDLEWIGTGVNSDGIFNPETPGTFDIEVESTMGGCSTSAFIDVLVGELPIVNAGENVEICGLQTELEGAGNGSSWVWTSDDNGVILSGENTLNPLVEGDFYGTVSYVLLGVSDQGCVFSDAVDVTYFEPVSELNLGEDILLFSDNPITLDSEYNGIGELNWIWNGPNDLSQTVIDLSAIEVSGFIPGEYELIVTVNNGPCASQTDSLLIRVDDLLIPTGFSPNGDNKNEAFVIRGAAHYEQIKLKVFSRSGIQVYGVDNYKNDWRGVGANGNVLPADTYYIAMELDDIVYQGYLVIRR
jgi:gliding motility-associated-like protein